MRTARPYFPRLACAGVVFAVKDSPLWLLPVITAAAVDVVVQGGPLSALAWLAAGAAVLLLQNYPTSVHFTRLYMGTVRRLGADIRNALMFRLQLLSMGSTPDPGHRSFRASWSGTWKTSS